MEREEIDQETITLAEYATFFLQRPNLSLRQIENSHDSWNFDYISYLSFSEPVFLLDQKECRGLRRLFTIEAERILNVLVKNFPSSTII